MKICLSIGILLCAAASAQPAESPQFVRENVLPLAGKAKRLGQEFPLSPLARGTGTIFHQPYTLANTNQYRLHFRLTGDVPPGNVSEIRIVPAGKGEGWVWRPSPGERERWSSVVPNNSTIEVHSTQPNSPIHAVIDQTLSVVPAAKKLAITPPDDRASIIGQPVDFVNWGKAVGRIRFMSDVNGGQYLCTGFLIANDLILTNQHCMKTQTEAASAQIDFDYDQDETSMLTINVRRSSSPTLGSTSPFIVSRGAPTARP